MLFLLRSAFGVIAGLSLAADATKVCSNATGSDNGHFYTFWHDAGSGCMTLDHDGRYGVEWQLDKSGNLVAGKGWEKGRLDRVVRYKAHAFVAGTNGYLALYGWSTDPLVEYYVVENWGDFTPPGGTAISLGTVTSDGGTYRLYRTRRINQPSIAGTATFSQYWSVRSAKRPVGSTATITFGNHVAAWSKLGLKLGTLNYQVIATEGFGSSGRSDIRLLDR
jgi:endo-1,4-beta-xylanase